MVWISQYRQYIAERICRPRLDEPLESYSVPELEQWVLLRRSADVGWKSEDIKLTRSRWVKQEEIGGTCIIPGGRWLLVGSYGSVTVYDLDASNLVERPLILQDAQHKQRIDRMAIEIDSEQQSPYLTFTLALSPAFYHGKAPTLLTET